MVASLSQLPSAAPVPPEEDVLWVENCVRLDPDLVRLSVGLWAGLEARATAAEEALARVRCPALFPVSDFYPTPAAPQSVHEEPSERCNERVVRFVNTGSLVCREQFEAFIGLVQRVLV